MSTHANRRSSIKLRLFFSIVIPLFMLAISTTVLAIYFISEWIIRDRMSLYNTIVASYSKSVEHIFSRAIEDGSYLASRILSAYRSTSTSHWNSRYLGKYSPGPDGAVRTHYQQGKTAGLFLSSIGRLDQSVKRMISLAESSLDIHHRLVGTEILNTYIVMPQQAIFIDDNHWISNIPHDFDFHSQQWAYMAFPNQNTAKTTTWSDIVYDPLLQQWAITNATPIYDGNTFLGSLNHDVSVLGIWRKMDQYQSGMPGSQHIILNKNGDLIYHPHTASMLKESPNDFVYRRTRDLDLLRVVSIHKPQNLTDSATSFRASIKGRQYMITCSYIQSIGWYYVQMVPFSIILSDVHYAAAKLVLAFMLAVILISLFVYFSAASFVIAPLDDMITRVRSLAKGIIPSRIDSTYTGELEDAKECINGLIDRYAETVRLAMQIARGDMSLPTRNEPSDDILRNALAQMFNNLKNMIYKLQAERELAQASNRSKSAFLANVNHDLRSPLNVVLGYSALLLKDSTLAKEHRDGLSKIHTNGMHLLALVDDVLEISKIEAGKATIHLSPFDLVSLFRDLEAIYSDLAVSKGISFSVVGIERIPRHVVGDVTKVRRIIANILDNALKFTSVGGITVRLEAADAGPEHVRLVAAIEDTGVGIPSAELAKVFRRFEQTGSGRESNRGTGLGMAISLEYARLLGGNIEVESTVGKGTTFRVELNVRRTSASDEIKDHNDGISKALEAHSRSIRLLVVEDEEPNRALLVHILESAGFQVKSATNGEEAVAAFLDWRPHLIWMDVRMPVMDGLEAARRIRANPFGGSTVIVALTAHALEEERDKCLAAGCDDFLRKPYQDQHIFDIVNRHLGCSAFYSQPDEFSYSTPKGAVASLSQERLTCFRAVPEIPAELHRDLVHACDLLDVEAVFKLLAGLKDFMPDTAEELMRLAEGYEFSEISRLLGDEPSAKGGTAPSLDTRGPERANAAGK